MKLRNCFPFISICLYFFLNASLAFAQAEFPTEAESPGLDPGLVESSFLKDYNNDGQLTILAFGDSIVRGRGDFIAQGERVTFTDAPRGEAGFPLRIESFLSIPVENKGVLGDRLTQGGIRRFARTMMRESHDIVVILMGANDAVDGVALNTFYRTLQTAINISFARGSLPVLATLTPTCCDRIGINNYTEVYSREVRALAHVNEIPFADFRRAYSNTCNLDRCNLLNVPEGLHPNIAGYDVMGETLIATLLKIDLFAPEGPAMLEMALNLPEGSIITKPDPLPIEETLLAE